MTLAQTLKYSGVVFRGRTTPHGPIECHTVPHESLLTLSVAKRSKTTALPPQTVSNVPSNPSAIQPTIPKRVRLTASGAQHVFLRLRLSIYLQCGGWQSYK